MKSLFQNALLFVFSCIVTLGIVEMGMRFFAKKSLSYLQSDQFCENDFINNSFELEKASIYHNNQQQRPYLNLQGKIYYANPVQNSLTRFLVNHSKLLSFLLPKIKILLEGSSSQKAANQAQHEEFKPADYLQAEKITDLGIQKIKLICKKNNAPLVSFPVDAPLLRATSSKTPYEVLMQQNGIEILGNLPEAIEKLERAGICCRAKDEAHWNHFGHQVCAQTLINRLQFVINHAIKQ